METEYLNFLNQGFTKRVQNALDILKKEKHLSEADYWNRKANLANTISNALPNLIDEYVGKDKITPDKRMIFNKIGLIAISDAAKDFDVKTKELRNKLYDQE